MSDLSLRSWVWGVVLLSLTGCATISDWWQEGQVPPEEELVLDSFKLLDLPDRIMMSPNLFPPGLSVLCDDSRFFLFNVKTNERLESPEWMRWNGHTWTCRDNLFAVTADKQAAPSPDALRNAADQQEYFFFHEWTPTQWAGLVLVLLIPFVVWLGYEWWAVARAKRREAQQICNGKDCPHV